MSIKDERLGRASRLTLWSSGLAMLIAFILLLLHQHVVSRTLMLEELHTEAAIVGANSAAALVFHDAKAAQETINTVRLSPRLYGGAMYRSDGSRLAWAGGPHRASALGGNDESPYPPRLSAQDVAQFESLRDGFLMKDVRVDGARVGTLLLEVDFSTLYWHLLEYAAGIVLIATAAWLLAYRLTQGMRERMARAEEQLAQLAFYDPVTGLPNRRLFQRELRLAVARVARERSGAALLSIDVDDFKKVNDTLGYAAGDEALTRIGERLTKTLRSGDVVAHLGGDEFGVILYGVDQPETVAQVTRSMLEAFRAPLRVLSASVDIRLSMGVLLLPCEVSDSEILMNRAAMAMDMAKTHGKNGFRFFSDDIDARIRSDLRMENRLRQALRNGGEGLSVVYQPQLGVSTQRLHGVEALVRWRQEDGQNVPPDAFVPIAERSDLIVTLGDWVLAQVCQDLAWLRTQGLELPRVAVNVSARQLQRGPELIEVFCQTLARFGEPVSRFEFELTESALMDGDGAVVLEAFHRAGFALSIDDFGTGYSSLGYLKRFRISELKIDRMFVSDLPQGKENAAIVKAVIQMSQALNIRVVAEGVESATQAAYLHDIGCHVIQGYWYARPMTPQALLNWNAAQDAAWLEEDETLPSPAPPPGAGACV